MSHYDRSSVHANFAGSKSSVTAALLESHRQMNLIRVGAKLYKKLPSPSQYYAFRKQCAHTVA